ncbi:MAG: hypothetical protein ABIT04_11180 [Novosphingobium sp.]
MPTFNAVTLDKPAANVGTNPTPAVVDVRRDDATGQNRDWVSHRPKPARAGTVPA